jgi:alginate O-acetyltransferase complex protein AlgI
MEFYRPPCWAFVALVVAVYWRLRGHGWRMGWLTLASAFFYAAFSPWFLAVLLASTALDYLVALRLPSASGRARRWLAGASVVSNLAVLCFFKYLAFALDSTRTLAGWLGLDVALPAWRLALPLGISFYTFEAISYVVDVAGGKAKPISSYRDYLLYLLFFPHLMAGPIVRAGDFAPQLARPKRLSWLRLELGVRLFLVGLLKKAVVADRIAAAIDPVFSAPGAYGAEAAWLAAIAYPLQMYGDFSGYSDMALGLAHMLGFKLPLNFRQPFFAVSIGDFWRRWHVSLSNWLRDYLYHPLGGSRHGTAATLRNLLAVMALSGLWHGAKWTMVAWGVMHGLMLCLERCVRLPKSEGRAWLAALYAGLTYLAVSLGFVLFRAGTFTHAGGILHAMFTGRTGLMLPDAAVLVVVLGLLAVLADHALGASRLLLPSRKPSSGFAGGLALASAATAVLVLIPETGVAFQYFQF